MKETFPTKTHWFYHPYYRLNEMLKDTVGGSKKRMKQK